MRPGWLNRRLFLRTTIFLLLGAIINIAVAWGFVLRCKVAQDFMDTGVLVSPYRQAGELWLWKPTEPAEREAVVLALEFWPALSPTTLAETYQQYSVQFWKCTGFRFLSGGADLYGTDGEWRSRREWRQVYGAGWPVLSLKAEVDREGTVRGGLTVPTAWFPASRSQVEVLWGQPQIQGILPASPLWQGFATNTLLFALLVGLSITAFRFIRSRLRISRGQCIGCGYDLSGADHAACPECGTPCAEQPIASRDDGAALANR